MASRPIRKSSEGRERSNGERFNKEILRGKGEKDEAGREEMASGAIRKCSEEMERRNGEQTDKEILRGKGEK